MFYICALGTGFGASLGVGCLVLGCCDVGVGYVLTRRFLPWDVSGPIFPYFECRHFPTLPSTKEPQDYHMCLAFHVFMNWYTWFQGIVLIANVMKNS